MKDKCSKYEGLFIFSDKETLLNHVNECEDCKLEHEKIQKVFCRTVDDFSLDNGFYTTEIYDDMAKHKCVLEWTFDGKNLINNHSKITCSNTFSIDNLHEKLIPYAFLECFLVGADTDCYFTETILNNKKHLKDYLGDFIGIMPPPRFRNIDEDGLIFRLKETAIYAFLPWIT